MHTEDEAKTKRCPMSYAAAQGVSHGGHTISMGNGGLGSGYAMVTAPSYCIGSGCMAWRIGREATPECLGYSDYARRDEMQPAKPALGYCGLAGPSAMPPAPMSPPRPLVDYLRRGWVKSDGSEWVGT